MSSIQHTCFSPRLFMQATSSPETTGIFPPPRSLIKPSKMRTSLTIACILLTLLQVACSGSQPITFSADPPLPHGVHLDEITGSISGVPSAPSSRVRHVITATSMAGTSTSIAYFEVLPVPVAIGQSFIFQSDFDGMGLIQHIGTSGGKRPFTNPAISGAINLTSSGMLTEIHHVVGQVERPSASLNRKDSWVSIELPAGLWIVPSRYSIMHGHSSDAGSLRNWSFEGSPDGENWTLLRRHLADDTLEGRYAKGTWSVGQTPPVRHLRVKQWGPNSTFSNELRIAGFEVYGSILIGSPASLLLPDSRRAPSPWYIKVWALEALVRGLMLQKQIAEAQGESIGPSEALSRLDAMGFACSQLPEVLQVLLGDEDEVRFRNGAMLHP
jgi:hypothetical protein